MDEDFREMSHREFLFSLSQWMDVARGGLGNDRGRSGRSGVIVRPGLLAEDMLRDDEEDDAEDRPSDSDDDAAASMEDDDTEAGGSSPSAGPVPSCSFLFPGRTFFGQQRLTGPRRPQEDWAVTATIYSVDFARGRLTGSLVAQNNPHSKRPVVTYFEGEIIDNVNHTFWTGAKWGAFPTRDTDVRYWGRCPGFGPELRAAVERHDGCAPQLGASQFVFMRWKECFFVDVPQECPLTITGFYYLSLDRTNGSIGGYYHDTRAAPVQVLQLRPVELCGAELDGPAGSAAGPTHGSAATPGGPSPYGLAGGAPSHGEWPAGMAFGSYSLC